jgi:hypothetical protein
VAEEVSVFACAYCSRKFRSGKAISTHLETCKAKDLVARMSELEEENRRLRKVFDTVEDGWRHMLAKSQDMEDPESLQAAYAQGFLADLVRKTRAFLDEKMCVTCKSVPASSNVSTGQCVRCWQADDNKDAIEYRRKKFRRAMEAYGGERNKTEVEEEEGS